MKDFFQKAIDIRWDKKEETVMPERKMSKKSLENLTISNRESNRLTRESLEISLLQLLEKKNWLKSLFLS